MENDRPPVLDYGPPPPHPLKRLEAAIITVIVFVARRQLRAVEVAVAGLLVLPVVYAAYAPGVKFYRYAHPFLFPFSFATVCVTLAAILCVVFRGSRTQTTAVLSLFVVTGPLTGLLQLERCPHAVYVQLVGVSIPIVGQSVRQPTRRAAVVDAGVTPSVGPVRAPAYTSSINRAGSSRNSFTRTRKLTLSRPSIRRWS